MVDRGLFDQKYHVALLGNPVVNTQSSNNYAKRQVLDPSFQPSNWDVICHNSKEYQDHVGNKRFKISVENHLNSYIKAPSRIAKSAIITNLVSSIRESSTQPGGGFVRYDESVGRWYEVGEKIARDKVGQALRDAARQRRMKHQKSSSVKSPSAAAAAPRVAPPPAPMNIDTKVKQEEQPQHLKLQQGDTTAKFLPPNQKKNPAKNKQVLLPISKKCFHFVHNTSSMPPRIHSSSSSSSFYKQQQSRGTSELASNTTTTDVAAATATARMLVEDSISNSRGHDDPGIDAADDLLQWFAHEDII